MVTLTKDGPYAFNFESGVSRGYFGYGNSVGFLGQGNSILEVTKRIHFTGDNSVCRNGHTGALVITLRNFAKLTCCVLVLGFN